MIVLYPFVIFLALPVLLLASTSHQNSILVVGSVNADIIIPIDSFPSLGETVVAKETETSGCTVAGGKGANQAVSCSRLGVSTIFVCQFGNDANADMLRQVLDDNKVDVSYCQKSNRPSGLGLVFLQDKGVVSSVVIGGANAAWPAHIDAEQLIKSIKDVSCILLQMEIPQYINELIAEAAHLANIPVFQDVGGEEREISEKHLKHCTYLSPNLTELKRLTKMSVASEDDILAAAKHLQTKGARHVLITLGSKGSLLLTEDGKVYKQPCCPIDNVIDETGAGDNYRAAFVVSHFIDKKTIEESMEFAAASGAVAVSKMGAIPACSTRNECMSALDKYKILKLRGGDIEQDDESQPFPFKFASRLNSMKDRSDLWINGDKGLLGWIQRQGTIQGLDLIDFNFPQHITSNTVDPQEKNEIITALHRANLKCGAICLRFPKETMQLGAFTHPNRDIRQRAIDMTKSACEWSIALDAREVVVWSAFDGYDYSLQVDYDKIWEDVVQAFQEVCDTYPTVKISLEYKPTDENTRFFAVPTTGAAILLMNEINRENFGLTLDFGHCIAAGENPAQSVAMTGRRINANGESKLFGVQLGDGYGRLGAEDGLLFGSVHEKAALEFVLWLIKTNYKGHIYFDTFPRNEDPVRECEYNIRQFKRMYKTVKRMLENSNDILENSWKNHDILSDSTVFILVVNNF
eukprot:gene6621-13411_t